MPATARGFGGAQARHAGIMAAGTALSRLSGFARVLAVGWVLGQGRLSDAYNQANTVPNTIYELLLGGVLSATLLPVVMQSLGKRAGEDESDAVPAIITVLMAGLVVATFIFWLLAPEIIHFYFVLKPASQQATAEQSLATTWLRLFAPQLLFIGLITITTALLNARRRFGAVAFSPVLANLVTIAALAVADRLVAHGSVGAYLGSTAAVAVVGIGTTAGYLAQLLAQLPALVRARVPLGLRWAPRHPALVKIARLSGWTVGAVVANQVSFTLVSLLALARGNGDYTAFANAYAFMLLPHAVLAVSVAYAVAPELAELWSIGDRSRFAAGTSQALRATVALVLPAGVGYALVAKPVVVAALAHGNLNLPAARLTGSLLVVFALGLPGFSAYLLLMRAFQAKQDTRSMFWLYVLENALTVALALALYSPLGIKGLTAAWIAPYTLCVPFAWWRLRLSAPVSVPWAWWARAGGATAVMGGVVAALVVLVPEPVSLALSIGRVAIVAILGAGVYLALGRALGLKELSQHREYVS
ncbi:MAG TPA: murein biosynthesis integral membrane protein MurJ [Acidimicrobiales bacterium]|nr:murein biosynthesis integral membrane protein MurJ [Acidimicrobiales bacterium]